MNRFKLMAIASMLLVLSTTSVLADDYTETLRKGMAVIEKINSLPAEECIKVFDQESLKTTPDFAEGVQKYIKFIQEKLGKISVVSDVPYSAEFFDKLAETNEYSQLGALTVPSHEVLKKEVEVEWIGAIFKVKFISFEGYVTLSFMKVNGAYSPDVAFISVNVKKDGKVVEVRELEEAYLKIAQPEQK